MDLTTVSILRMWLFTVALAQVITAALDVEQHFYVYKQLIAKFPRPPPPFVFWLVFSVIHDSRRVAKIVEVLRTLVT